MQAVRVESAGAGPFDVGGKLGAGQPQASHVDAMRAAGRVAREALSAAPQQARGTASVASQRVGQADGYLSQALPQVALGRRRGLPGRLKHLMRVERAVTVNQFLGGRQRFQRRQGPVVSRWLADRVPGQRAAERVARPGIPRSPGRIAISARGH
jgi:hypothetical protein